MITCRVCLVEQSEDNYYTTPAGNYRRKCKHCEHKQAKERLALDPAKTAEMRLTANRKHKYGVNREQVHEMLDRQNNLCGLCEENTIDYMTAHLDHCHNSLAVRGLLCRLCNNGLGLFRDRTDLMRKAIAYLERG